MDIDEIRRANLARLEEEAGSISAIAARVDMTYSQYLNLRNGALDKRSGKRRGMRKETAWRFEDKFDKPRGWLDQDHSGNTPPIAPADRSFLYQVQEAVARYEIPDSAKQTVLTLLKAFPPRAADEDQAKVA